jgi:trehalose 6-phosphate synthase
VPDVDLPVVLLSHRGPVSFRRTRAGRVLRRGAGGLVSALMGLAEHLDDAVWVCAAATKEDAAVAAEHEGSIEIAFQPSPRLLAEDEQAEGPTLSVRYVEVDRDRHEEFYTQIANPLLWFIQHGLYGLATAPQLTADTRHAFEHGYAAVNQQFADAVCDELRERNGQALVMLHDYHFYLVGAMVRAEFPDALVSHFVHIPWPDPDALRILPPDMRDRILEGLLGCDVVAFHTQRSARNFLLCAQEILDLPVDLRRMCIDLGGRQIVARAYPISIDIEAVETLAGSDTVHRHQETLRENYLDRERKLILRVDRTDPSKNIVRGFKAFGQLLDDHPELDGQVTFLAALMPSRQDVPEYADYLADIGAAVAEVNARHHQPGWQPIDLRLQEDLAFAIAAYTLYDVLVVNSVNDGMNLVAKEAVLVNERDGVLTLSENTGAHEELGDYAVTLHPFDVQQQADALYAALTMEPDERHKRLQAAASIVRDNDVSRWLDAQIADLEQDGG